MKRSSILSYPELIGLSYDDSIKALQQKIYQDSEFVGEPLSENEQKKIDSSRVVLDFKKIRDIYHVKAKQLIEKNSRDEKDAQNKSSPKVDRKQSVLQEIQHYYETLGIDCVDDIMAQFKKQSVIKL